MDQSIDGAEKTPTGSFETDLEELTLAPSQRSVAILSGLQRALLKCLNSINADSRFLLEPAGQQEEVLAALEPALSTEFLADESVPQQVRMAIIKLAENEYDIAAARRLFVLASDFLAASAGDQS
jgi:hypothetical protein